MSILKQDPRGRLDIALVRVAETICKGHLEQACNGLPLWNAGLGQVVEAVVTGAVPGRQFQAMDVAQAMGLVAPPRRRANVRA